MRRHVESARDRGVPLAFLGADACYWQIRFEPNARGEADRTIVGYKEAAGNLDPLALDGRPQNDRLITGRWRDRPVSRSEERLVGVMYATDPVDAHVEDERRRAADHEKRPRPHAADRDQACAHGGRVAAEPDCAARLGRGDRLCFARMDLA